jgi:hypothetical protein
MSLYRKFYPQVYPAYEIVESMSYPHAPFEPKAPNEVDRTPPSKYPNLHDNLTLLGMGCIAWCISFLLRLLEMNFFVVSLIVLFSFVVVYAVYETFKSILLCKTYKERLLEYQKAISKYEEDYKSYLQLKAKYDIEKKEFDTLYKSQTDILNYRLNQRKIFLQKIKSKSRHDWFYERDEQNPKLGRAEYFFRNYISKALFDNRIPQGFDLFFDTSVMVSSFSVYSKISYFYPDLLVLTPRGLMIDVEIDEPYTADSHTPIHCNHSFEKSDSDRNKYFTESNCSVLRFTERQIIKYPEVCLSIILQFDDYASIPSEMELPNDFKEKAWNETDAKRMASENYRDTY